MIDELQPYDMAFLFKEMPEKLPGPLSVIYDG